MKKMPYTLKQKLRQYDNAQRKAHSLHAEIVAEFEKYGVPYDNLTANSEFGDFPEDEATEGMAFINNNEGRIEDNIAEIEEVFLIFANKNC